MHLPEGVGYTVGAGTKIDNLVLQVNLVVHVFLKSHKLMYKLQEDILLDNWPTVAQLMTAVSLAISH